MIRSLSVTKLTCRTWGTTLTLSLILFVSLADSTFGQSPGRTLVRVEEDWVALIAGPDSQLSSPQIVNIISPSQSTDGVFGLTQLNHRGAPEFRSGGIQVQGWIGTSMASHVEDSQNAELNRTSDYLRYTIAMEKMNTGIKFQLFNGRSRTWGQFAQTPISVTVPAATPSLEDYSPEFSVASTNVNLGAHRVDLVYLDTTRFTYSDGETVTDTTNRVIHRYQLKVEDVSLAAFEANPEDYSIGITE